MLLPLQVRSSARRRRRRRCRRRCRRRLGLGRTHGRALCTASGSLASGWAHQLNFRNFHVDSLGMCPLHSSSPPRSPYLAASAQPRRLPVALHTHCCCLYV